MACIQESRPGQSTRIELGGNFAQPNASVHSTWTGQMVRQLGWTGERNSGQPVYAAFDYNQNQTEIDARFRQEVGQVLEQVTADKYSSATPAKDDVDQNRITMQLLTLTFSA